MCHVTFNWGAYSTPGNNKNYTVDYYTGDNIDDADIRYGLDDLIPEGLGWDGKFYYDQAHTNEVIFDCDTVERDITIYANVFKVIRFNAKDATNPLISLDGVTFEIGVDAEHLLPAELLYCPEYTDFQYVIMAPTSQTFTIAAYKEEYSDYEEEFTVARLDTGAILMEKALDYGSFAITAQWFPKNESGEYITGETSADFDSYIQIYDSNMDMVYEDTVSGYESHYAHLFYGSHTRNEKVEPNWASASGYDDWLAEIGRENKAYAATKFDGIFYELDYDSRSGKDVDGNILHIEHMTGKVNLNGNRVYRFMLNDCDGDGHMSYYESKVSVVFNGKTYRYEIPSGGKRFWVVFDIKKVNGVWRVVEVNKFDNFGPFGLETCPGVDEEFHIDSAVTNWDTTRTITLGEDLVLNFNNENLGYEIEFTPSESGDYNFSAIANSGLPMFEIIDGDDNYSFYRENWESPDIYTTIPLEESVTYTFKICLIKHKGEMLTFRLEKEE
jgi:hypothetical protein